LLPFGHKPFGDSRQLAPGNAADPFDPLDISVLLVTKGLVYGEREIRNGLRSGEPNLLNLAGADATR
jgi:hypothetical protein